MKRTPGLRFKVIGPLLVVTVCAGIAGGALFGHSLSRHKGLQVEQRARAIAIAVTLAAEAAPSPASLHRFVSALGAERGVESIIVFGGKPLRVVAGTRAAWLGLDASSPALLGVTRDLSQILSNRVPVQRFELREQRFDFGVPLLLPTGSGLALEAGAVIVSLDHRLLSATDQHLFIEGLLVLLAMLTAVAIAAGVVLGTKVLAPLGTIQRVVARRKAGDENAMIPQLAGDEIGELAADINRMIDGLTQSRDQIRKQAEELLVQASELHVARDEALAAARTKASFLATVSHEIRTPMNGVIGMTNLLLDEPLEPRQREYVEAIEQSGETLLVLINDVLDFSRIESGRLEIESIPLCPRELCRAAMNSVRLSAEARGIELALQCADDLPQHILGDPTRIRQILINLLGNAVKFSEPGGRIEAAVGRLGERQIRFEVTDQGIGIPDDRLATLFDPFVQADASTTRHYGGTGLGLAICRQLVDWMGGTIGVDSEVGKGSRFWFDLPLEQTDETVEDGLLEGDRTLAPELELRVLVAEDNLVNQKVAQKLIERFDCEVAVVADGAAAVESVMRGSFDLVLMDCQMPGMDGLEATRQIRRRMEGGPRIPIVALTANAFPEDRKVCLAAGMDDYLAKPLRKDDLQSLLERVASGTFRSQST